MIIDYSVSSNYLNFAATNCSYGMKHIALACTAEIPFALMGGIERIAHLIIGVLECIPGVGHLIALGDYLINRRMQILYLHDNNPYQNGLQHGRALKKEIQTIYALVNDKIQERIRHQGRDPFENAVTGLQRRVSDEMLAEMQGLAAGAEVPLDQVFQVHTFLDIYAGMYGCSAVASRINNRERVRAAVTNHFQYQIYNLESVARMQLLLQAPLNESALSHQRALQRVGRDDTLQSIVFDVDAREVQYSFAWSHAPTKTFSSFRANFPPARGAPRNQVKLATNLDWPWKVLAPYTLLIDTAAAGKNRFINVTFPGFIGVLRGMNQDGLSLSCCQAGDQRQNAGVPNVFLFRDLLERAHSTQDALQQLPAIRPASSMNLILAAPDGIATLELDPARAEAGVAQVTDHHQ